MVRRSDGKRLAFYFRLGIEALGLHAFVVACKHMGKTIQRQFCGVSTAARTSSERRDMLGNKQT